MTTLNELYKHISQMIGRDICDIEKDQIRFRVVVLKWSFEDIIKVYETKQPHGSVEVLKQYEIKL